MITIQEEIATFMQKLQALGYAVAIVTPEELRGVSASQLEYHMLNESYEIIDQLSEE